MSDRILGSEDVEDKIDNLGSPLPSLLCSRKLFLDFADDWNEPEDTDCRVALEADRATRSTYL